MKPAVKYFLITVGALILLAPILYVLAVTSALKSHVKEDRVISESKRIEEAINDYTGKYGKPPPKLEDLVPDFIEEIPSFPEMAKVDYNLSNYGKEWTLDLHWTNSKVPLIYRRTNAGLDSEDTERKIDTRNGCYVLKAR